jgi:hypothetical protein
MVGWIKVLTKIAMYAILIYWNCPVGKANSHLKLDGFQGERVRKKEMDYVHALLSWSSQSDDGRF